MTIYINTSIFAHIELDSELLGRFGVQGNTFGNTFGYLNQYFKTLDNVPPNVQNLAKAMDELVKREQYIRGIHGSFIHPKRLEYFRQYLPTIPNELLLIWEYSPLPVVLSAISGFSNYIQSCINTIIPPNTLEYFAEKTAIEIETLQPNENILLPGGWLGTDGPGHAMIYQFKKNEAGELIFSIYNSGAGINRHDQTSSTEKELYSPVQRYKLPAPVDPIELQNLVKRLTIPQLAPGHPARENRKFNAYEVYQDIEKSLVFLKYKQVDSDLSSAQLTTGSQLSGTCAQRSIHQMLKLNFDNLAEYQQFILKFKLHALKDFIQTHPSPRSSQITDLIQKAISNNLKIIQEPDVFEDDLQKIALVDEFESLQHALDTSDIKEPSPDFIWIVALYTLWQWIMSLVTSNRFASNIVTFDVKDAQDIPSHPPLLPTLKPESILSNLGTLITQCKEQSDSNPLWAMDQIEQAMLQLPIPSKYRPEPPYFDAIPFYSSIQTADDYEAMVDMINELYHLYMASSEAHLTKSLTLPTQVVTMCSFLALHDYFDVMGEAKTGKPTFHNYLSSSFSQYLNTLQSYPHLASHNPAFDQRLAYLRSLTYSSPYNRGFPEHPELHYQAIVDSEPELKAELEALFESQGHGNNLLTQSLRQKNLTGLFALLHELDSEGNVKNTRSVLKEERFKPLIKKMKRHFKLEKYVIDYLRPLKSKVVPSFTFNFTNEYGGNGSHAFAINRNIQYNKNDDCWIQTHIEAKYYDYKYPLFPHEKECITHYKYNVANSPAKLALIGKHFHWMAPEHVHNGWDTPNRIQLGYYDKNRSIRNITKDDYFNRDLFNLRLSPKHQIKLTLDYFSKTESVAKLDDPNLQRYVEANLFEPDRLFFELRQNPAFLKHFNAFIDKGIRYFSGSEHLLSQDALFFIRLKTNMSRYVVLHQPNEVSHQYLLDNYAALNKLISMQSDPFVLASLHSCRFLSAMTQLELNSSDNTLLKEAFLSYVYTQAKQNPYYSEDTATHFEQQRAGLHFKDHLRTLAPETMKALVIPWMESLDLNVSQCKLTGEYPRFHVEDAEGNPQYTVNAEQGRVYQSGYSLSTIPVYQSGYSLSTIPLDIKHHPLMKRLGLENASSCWLSEDETLIRFPKQPVRIKKMGNALAIQKQWAVNDEDARWYQLKPLSEAQQTLFGLPNVSVPWHALPDILSDASIEAWVCGTDALLVQHGKPIYQIDSWGTLHQLNDTSHRNGRMRTTTPLADAALLATFEDPSFFTVNLDEATGTEGTVDFTRYGLSLQVSDRTISLPNSNYQLTDATPLGKNIGALSFSNNHDELCIVAVQRFYVDDNTPQTKGLYYRTTHDISGHIPNKLLSEESPDQARPIWEHRNTQRAITYKMVQGIPKPDSAADALYLCYLYLGTNDTNKAWAVLEDIRLRLSLDGSVEELTYLSWIVEALPTILDKKKDADRQFQTPEYIACQLKALTLYADFLKLGQPSEIPKPILYDAASANGRYEQLYLKQLQAFSNNFPSTIYYLYQRHMRGRRHLDETYTLHDDECMHLLDCCDPHQTDNDSPIAYGSLGYERRRLSLKLLLKEHQRLSAIRDISTSFPADFVKRLDDIEKHISREMQVMKKRTKIEWIPYTPTLSTSSDINEGQLSAAAKASFNEWRYKVYQPPMDIDDALNKLNSGIKQDDFMRYFPTYLHVAREGTEAQKDKLQLFCTQYLTAFRHDASENIPYLSNILYRALENPTTFQADRDTGLMTLTTIASSCDITPLKVPQAKDVFEEILSSNQDIWDALAEKMPPHDPMPPCTAVYPEPLYKILGMQRAMQAYQQAEINYTDAMHNTEDEQEAGQLKLDRLKTQRQTAETVFQPPEVRAQLARQAQAILADQEPVLKNLWAETIAQANSGDLHPIQRLAKQRHAVTRKELLRLYLHADMTLYIEKTGLSNEACVALHQQIHKAVSLEIQQQHTLRLVDALTQATLNTPPELRDIHQIASILMAENTPQAQIDPGLMLLQNEDNILIRPRQAEALGHLLSTPDDPYHVTNDVEKIIMGGGKTKVVIPALAEKKATGLNLVVIEVPRALLATNHADLNATSQRLYGKRSKRFEFNRDSECSANRLEIIYQTFIEVMTNRDYLVTTGESMQSLQLKYLDLLLSPSEGPEWKQQVYWARKIIGLLKQRGDVIIDEVHLGLLLKKKLNYTLGSPEAISPRLIQHSIALYQFVDVLEGRAPSLDDLLSHPESPLNKYNHKLTEADLRSYLSNQSISVSIQRATPEIKDALAFYKEQLTLLPQTQSRHYKEHYGPSEQPSSALERALAIPYLASNQPNERSRFGNVLETINYSIQSLLHEGVNKALLKQLIEQWKKEARNEVLDPSSRFGSISETKTAARVDTLLAPAGLTLASIDLRSGNGDEQIATLLEHLQHDRALLYSILKDHILAQITVEPAILHSDSCNHVDIYRTVQGISGTPWNSSTYHQRLNYNPQTSLGTDGYIQAVLKEKETPITRAVFTNIDAFVESLFKTKANTHAVIDISATFAGYSNLHVARTIAEKAQMYHPSIQFILYFNESDVLCAYNIKTSQSTLLATSDPNEINQKLGCTPEARITYYDQSHTLGTDLKQSPTAHAFVLTDKRTHMQSALQGCMRMRGLDEQQHIHIIVPEDAPDNLDELFALMEKTQAEQLQQDNFFAAIANMDNLIRQNFLDKIAELPDEDADSQCKLAEAFQTYFIESIPKTLFEQYGDITVEQSTQLLLESRRTQLMQDWERCLTDAKLEKSADESTALAHDLDAIVKKYAPLCHENTLSRATHSQALGTAVEHEKEKQKETEKETLKEAMCFDKKLSPAQRRSWSNLDRTAPETIFTAFVANGKTPDTSSLNDKLEISKLFSKNLLVDENYATVFEGQKELRCHYLKPVEGILFRKDGDNITACLIDMLDLAELNELIQHNGEPHVWISTTQHTLLSGTFPEGIIQNNEYQSLVEQIRFFNGELNSLREQEEPLCWLNTAAEDKITYFREQLIPYRQTTLTEVNALQASVIPTAHYAQSMFSPVKKDDTESEFVTKNFKPKS